jgi:hypothetical protein
MIPLALLLLSELQSEVRSVNTMPHSGYQSGLNDINDPPSRSNELSTMEDSHFRQRRE